MTDTGFIRRAAGRGRRLNLLSAVFAAAVSALTSCSALASESATGFVSFLAVTGKPGPADVSAKVEALHQRGVRSLVVYARSGLDYEYMGEDWLKTVERFCEETFRRGMKVWLYDEYNWPSGTCKGRVPRENDQWRYAEYGVFRNPDGSYRWVTALAPQGWVNVCEPAAVDRFIELTHEVYAKRLKKWFDNGTVEGIFTDEPGHPTKVTFDDGKPLVSFRRFSGLEDEYEAATGRALKVDVERWLDGTKTDPAAAKRAPAGDVWCVYADLMGRRFRNAYFDKIRTWCDRHGILFTGHLIAENELLSSARCNGNPVLCLRGESLPGMDEIRTAFDSSDDARIKIEWVTYNLARQAILSRGRGGMVELYACGPADHVPATLRNLLWQCACHGIDRYFSSMEVMDMRGLVEKHGYFSPTGLVHPWFEQCAREFVDEANLAATWARKTVSEREVAVRYPRRGTVLAAFAGAKTPDLNRLLGALEKNQMTCRLIDENETTDLPLVFSCVGEDAFAEERTGRTGLSSAEAVRLCRERLPCTFEVLEEDGRPATDLLVRTYEYGAAVVVNLMPFTDRRLIAIRQGRRVPFELAGRDVRLFWSDETPPPPDERKVVQTLGGRATGKMPIAPEMRATGKMPIAPGDGREWSLSVDADNLFRVKFDRGRTARVQVEKPLKGVRLVARHYTRDYAVTDGGRPVGLNEEPPKGVKVIWHVAEPYAFTMDGRPVAATEPCQALRSGYAPLYRETPPFDLAAGEHVFEMPSGELDRNYFLPALLVAGEFAEKDGKLQPLERQGVKAGSFADVGLSGLVGSATWTTKVTVPKDLAFLRLSTGGRVANVKLCGADLGTRLWAPFEWQVPKALRGREGELEVRVFTSVQPMFGPAKGGDWDMRFWFGANGPDGPGGLLAADFVTRVVDPAWAKKPQGRNIWAVWNNPTPEVKPEYELLVDGKPVETLPVKIDFWWREVDTNEYGGVYWVGSFPCVAGTRVKIRSAQSLEQARFHPADRIRSFAREGVHEVSFVAEGPFRVAFERDGRNKPLILFGNAPERDTPNFADPSVIRFGPGVHRPGQIKLTTGQTLYLDYGAIVYGGVYAEGDNITVRGHGVLSGAAFGRYKGPGNNFFLAYGCKDLQIRDVTLTAPWSWTLALQECDRVKIDGVRVCSSRMINEDALDLVNCRDVEIRNCFLRAQDDLLTTKGAASPRTACGRILVENCDFWCDLANVMRLGGESDATAFGPITVRNIDVWHHSPERNGHYRGRYPEAVFWLGPGDGTPLRDVLIENVRVYSDGHEFYLANLNPRQTTSAVGKVGEPKKWFRTKTGGSISNVVFRNVRVYGKPAYYRVAIEGRSDLECVKDVTLENVELFGRCLDAYSPEVIVGPFASDVKVRCAKQAK